MPEVPDNVPIYISSDFADADADSGDDSAASSSTVKAPSSRESLLEDRSASTWQPYLPTQAPEGRAEAIGGRGLVENATAAESLSPTGIASPNLSAFGLPSNRNTLILLALAAANLFAFGVWAGFYLIPHEPINSSLKPNLPNFFADPSMSEHSAVNLIAVVAAKANPSVVTIDIKFAQALLSENGSSRVIPPAEASGLIVRSDGYILTNSHVIHRDSDIKVTLNDKRVFAARLVGRDDFSDLAVVKIDATALPVLKFADSKTVKPGDWAIAIGSPLGFDHTLTVGVISAINRSLSDFKNRVGLIQHDAALNLGNSGGPLLNINGEVIGINTAVRSQAVCIGFATPSDVAAEVARRLISDGQIPRAYLGVYMEDIDPERTRSLTLPSHPVAVKISRLASGGPAEKAGMKAGDIISKINGIAVKSKREVRELTQASKPGDRVNIVVQRQSQSLPITVVIGDLSKESPEF
ncbi:trypsin-like peptidase domain-containing protein [bacterium]|nr:trypsin-like peptidase domain-containing protein [bacterium]MBP9808322.1 trypsin-like peptidase domain-containing protein [bacterium]